MQRLSLFEKLLGTSFATLSPAIRQVHTGESQTWSGRCAIQRGRNPLTQLAALIAGMPPASSDVAVRIQIDVDDDGEYWRRRFGTRAVVSRLTAHDGLLIEKLGPLAIEFKLSATHAGICWTPRHGKVCGIPLPARFFSGITATELVVDDQYTFDVTAALPFIGLIIRYRGWLRHDDQ